MSRSSVISAEARGALRVWKERASARYAAFDQAYRDPANRPIVEDFVGRAGTTGRSRAFEKLRRRFHRTAFLEGVRVLTEPMAVWAAPVSAEGWYGGGWHGGWGWRGGWYGGPRFVPIFGVLYPPPPPSPPPLRQIVFVPSPPPPPRVVYVPQPLPPPRVVYVPWKIPAVAARSSIG